MRCKACDSIMRPSEIIWNEEYKRFDDDCYKCKSVEGVKEYLAEFKDETTDDEEETNDDSNPA